MVIPGDLLQGKKNEVSRTSEAPLNMPLLHHTLLRAHMHTLYTHPMLPLKKYCAQI